MLKFQLATKADLREAASIQQRQKFEDDRKARIFNARNRIIGVDVEGLGKQIAEKRQIDEIERERQKQFDAEDQRRAAVLNKKNQELREERHRIESEINNYRKTYQKKEDTREYDLNDPQQFKNSIAARTGDNDPRLGISSAQKFLGEDLMNPERKRAQQNQQRAWLQQQMLERQQAENDRRKADKTLQMAVEARDRRALELDAAERQSRRQIQSSAARFNLNLAASHENRKLSQKREEDEDNLAEIYNNLTSDMLTENRNCADSNFGVRRKNVANYRGMNDEEIDKFELQRAVQAKEHEIHINEAKSLDAQWDQMTRNQTRFSILKQRELERKKKALMQQLQEENNHIADEQKARNNYLDNVVFTNQPTMEYFSQFNTSTR